MKRLTLIGLGFGLALLAQSYFARKVAPNDALLLFALAGVCVAIAIGASAWPEALTDSPRPVGSNPVSSRDGAGRLTLALAALLAVSASIQLVNGWNRLLYDAGLLLCLAAALAAYGFSRLEGWTFRGNLRAIARAVIEDRWSTLALLAILIFGAYMRLGRLDYYPPANGVGIVDEAQVGKIANDILSGQRPWTFLSSIYPAALFLKLFGETLFVLRLPFALYGVAMIVPMYLLARLIVGKPAALAATMLFAASRWNATINREIIAPTPEAFIELLAFYFLYRGLKGGGGMSFALAGACAVLGLYGYAASRIVPLIMAVLIVATLVASAYRLLGARTGDQRRTAQRMLAGQVRGFGIFAVGALVVLLPYLGIVAHDPHNAFTERFTSVLPIATAPDRGAVLHNLGQRILSVLYLFNFRGDGSPLYNIPGEPMLDPVSGILLAVAFVCCLIYVWKGHTILPVAWFGLTLIGGAILTNDLQAYRVTGVTPAIYLLIAFLLDALVRVVRRVLKSRERILLAVPALAVLCVGAYWNYHQFFDLQINDPAVRREYMHTTEMTAAYIAAQPGDPFVHLMASFPFYERGMDFGWIAGFPRGEREMTIAEALPHRQDDGAALYVFAQPWADGEAGEMVTALYPDAVCERGVAPWGDQFYVGCRVSSEATQNRRGLPGIYYAGPSTTGEPVLERKDATLDFSWANGVAPIAGQFSAEWQAALYMPDYGPKTIGVESSAPFTVTVDGAVLSSVGAAERTLTLAQGWHVMTARLSGASPSGQTRLYTVKDGKKVAIEQQYLASFDAAHGLLGRFYAGPSWQGNVLLQRIDPFMDVFANPESPEGRPLRSMPDGPFSAEWTATLSVTDEGVHKFRASAISGMSELIIDDKPVVKSPLGDYNQSVSAEGEVSLTLGRHALRFRYTYQRGYMARAWLYWSPPGQAMGLIPYQNLAPFAP